MTTLREALGQAARALAACGVPDPRIDAGWILAAVTGKPRLALALDNEALKPGEAEHLGTLLARRAAGEPLQYVLGEEWFCGLRFAVDSRVLIPRPETELLCEQALRVLNNRPARVLELCTGSGALAVALALGCPDAQVSACDISAEALEVAQANARAHGAAVRFAQGDLFAPYIGERFDLIVANPPYVARSQLSGLARELAHEPRLALDGGPDGLAFYRRIAEEACAHLEPGGCLALEIGADQAQAVLALLARDFVDICLMQDLAGRDRVVTAVAKLSSGNG